MSRFQANLPWSNTMHIVMKNRAVTNPPHVVDSTNVQENVASHRESDEEELLSLMPEESLSLEECRGKETPSVQQSSERQPPSIKDGVESGPANTTPSVEEKSTASQPALKKKTRKVSKIDKSENTRADMLDGVMKKLAEQRNHFAKRQN